MAQKGRTIGVDSCEHAEKSIETGSLPAWEVIQRCPVCLRRWYVAESRLGNWFPLPHTAASLIRDQLVDRFVTQIRTGSELAGSLTFGPFWAHLDECRECEAGFAVAVARQLEPVGVIARLREHARRATNVQWFFDQTAKKVRSWTVFDLGQPRPNFAPVGGGQAAFGTLMGLSRGDQGGNEKQPTEPAGTQPAIMGAGNVEVGTEYDTKRDGLVLRFHLRPPAEAAIVRVYRPHERLTPADEPLFPESDRVVDIELTSKQPNAEHVILASDLGRYGQIQVLEPSSDEPVTEDEEARN